MLPGIGKTEAWNATAKRIAVGDVHEESKDAKLFLLNLDAIESASKEEGEINTGVRGGFETIWNALLEEVRQRRAKGENIIIITDELHRLEYLGKASGSLGGSESVKTPMSSGELIMGGSTTKAEHQQHIASNQALGDRFDEYELKNPAVKRVINLIKKMLKAPEKEFSTRERRSAMMRAKNLEISPDSIIALVEYVDEHISHRARPRASIEKLLKLINWFEEKHPKEKTITPERVRTFMQYELGESIEPLADKGENIPDGRDLQTLEDKDFEPEQRSLISYEERSNLARSLGLTSREIGEILRKNRKTLDKAWENVSQNSKLTYFGSKFGEITTKFIEIQIEETVARRLHNDIERFGPKARDKRQEREKDSMERILNESLERGRRK